MVIPMVGPLKTVRELYEAKKTVYDKRTGRKKEVFAFPQYRRNITKKGPFYYIKKEDGRGNIILDNDGHVKWFRIKGSDRVWHRRRGRFSHYTSKMDRKIKSSKSDFPKYYHHTGDRKKK